MMKKVLIFVNTLRGGGVERIAVDFANELSKHCDVTLQTLSDEGAFKSELSDSVNYKSIISNRDALRKVKKYFISEIFSPSFVHSMFVDGKYDYEIAFSEGFPTKVIGASKNRKSLKFAWIHNDLDKRGKNDKVFSSLYKELRAYMSFNKIICATEDVKGRFLKRFEIEDNDNILVKNAFIDILPVKEKATEVFKTNGRFRLVSVGRLEKQKGFERLLWVMKKLVSDGIDCELIIVGEGSRHDELEGYIKYNGLKTRVLLTGFSDNPYKYINSADLCVFPLRYDGHSAAAVEALVLGKPIVACECNDMLELLGNSEYGLITENSDDALYEGVKKLILDEKLRNEYKAMAKKRADEFSVQGRIKDVLELFSF